MLFYLIPLSLIAVSILAIGIIIWRKLPYARKLTPDSQVPEHSLFYDFFPEAARNFGSGRIKEYLSIWLQEIEKLIRKIRLLFSRVDRLSDSMIKRIRKVNQQRVAKEEAKESVEETLESKIPEYVDVPTVQVRGRRSTVDAATLKKEEQRLIVEIAHAPKNPRLYRELGEVYVKMKNYDDAKESFSTALKFNPADEVSQRKLALVLQKLEPVDGSIEIEK